MFVRSFVTVLAAVALAAQTPDEIRNRDLGKGVNFYSLAKEAELGKAQAEDLLRQVTKLDNPYVQAYVERVGRKLAEHLPAIWTFTFTVIADDRSGPTHEPIALPGGYIFVPEVLVYAAQDEAEFAGMLAHAMIHVAARHGTRQATRGEIAKIANRPVSDRPELRKAAETLIPIGFLKFRRDHELEADRFAVPTMAAAGYDPAALLRYIKRVETETESDINASVFSPMPAHAR